MMNTKNFFYDGKESYICKSCGYDFRTEAPHSRRAKSLSERLFGNKVKCPKCGSNKTWEDPVAKVAKW